eukprot:TRINITY_DN8021_c0_g1_i1.p1 TRINITY_DN8021_c0_g1~~TRINITY_DN8021_c0_g1_i1.p1  ORF type:complete len:921 (+),score=211.14 TRINITY_DN8021_c0_g1_i1:75-2765(+)
MATELPSVRHTRPAYVFDDSLISTRRGSSAQEQFARSRSVPRQPISSDDDILTEKGRDWNKVEMLLMFSAMSRKFTRHVGSLRTDHRVVLDLRSLVGALCMRSEHLDAQVKSILVNARILAEVLALVAILELFDPAFTSKPGDPVLATRLRFLQQQDCELSKTLRPVQKNCNATMHSQTGVAVRESGHVSLGDRVVQALTALDQSLVKCSRLVADAARNAMRRTNSRGAEQQQPMQQQQQQPVQQPSERQPFRAESTTRSYAVRQQLSQEQRFRSTPHYRTSVPLQQPQLQSTERGSYQHAQHTQYSTLSAPATSDMSGILALVPGSVKQSQVPVSQQSHTTVTPTSVSPTRSSSLSMVPPSVQAAAVVRAANATSPASTAPRTLASVSPTRSTTAATDSQQTEIRHESMRSPPGQSPPRVRQSLYHQQQLQEQQQQQLQQPVVQSEQPQQHMVVQTPQHFMYPQGTVQQTTASYPFAATPVRSSPQQTTRSEHEPSAYQRQPTSPQRQPQMSAMTQQEGRVTHVDIAATRAIAPPVALVSTQQQLQPQPQQQPRVQPSFARYAPGMSPTRSPVGRQSPFYQYNTTPTGQQQQQRYSPTTARGFGSEEREFRACLFCGKTNHATRSCFYKKPCEHCGLDNHTANVCRRGGGGRAPDAYRRHYGSDGGSGDGLLQVHNEQRASVSPGRVRPLPDKRVPVPRLDTAPGATCERAAQYAAAMYKDTMQYALSAEQQCVLTVDEWTTLHQRAIVSAVSAFTTRAVTSDRTAYEQCQQRLRELLLAACDIVTDSYTRASQRQCEAQLMTSFLALSSHVPAVILQQVQQGVRVYSSVARGPCVYSVLDAYMQLLVPQLLPLVSAEESVVRVLIEVASEVNAQVGRAEGYRLRLREVVDKLFK